MDNSVVEMLMDIPYIPKLKGVEDKRFVVDPDISILKDEQAIAFNDLKAFVESDNGEGGIHVLEGYAGTGKSFLINTFVEWVLFNTHLDVAVTATTNKAVLVNKKFSEYKDGNLKYSTVHSLLGLVEKISSTGEQYFAKDFKRDSYPIDNVKLLIVDETSMLNDELFGYLVDYIIRGLKVIFVGDVCQIPPINSTESIPFDVKNQEEYGMGVSKLTNIIRQKQGNPIIETTLKVRKFLGRDTVLPVRENNFDPVTGDGVFFLGTKDRKIFYKLLHRYFTSENFKDNTDFCKVLVWQNDTVDIINDIIRIMLHGRGVGKLVVGERLVCNKPVFRQLESEKVKVFNNSDELEVVSISTGSKFYKLFEIKFYIAVVKHQSLDEEVKQHIHIVHEDSEEDYYKILKHLEELAKDAPKKSFEAKTKWVEFFRFKQNFADVNYNYATTTHKSQGSTYNHAFVIESDIDQYWLTKEKNRIKYTAFTRPSNRLIIIT